MVGVGSMPSALNFSKICEFLVNPGAANSTFVGDTVEQKQTSAACKDTFNKISLFTKSSPAGRQKTQHTHNTIISMTLCKCDSYFTERVHFLSGSRYEQCSVAPDLSNSLWIRRGATGWNRWWVKFEEWATRPWTTVTVLRKYGVWSKGVNPKRSYGLVEFWRHQTISPSNKSRKWAMDQGTNI